MSDTASIRSVSTAATEYVPLEKSATSFVEELKSADDKSVVIQKIFSHEDGGNILSHVFTHPKTRQHLWEFFDQNTDWCLQQMEQYSDPRFVALGFMCKKRPQKVPLILERISPLLKESSAPLAVMARVDTKLIDPKYTAEIVKYLTSEDYFNISLAIVVLAKLLQEKRDEVAVSIKKIFTQFPFAQTTADNFKILSHLYSIDQQLASEIYHALPEFPATFWGEKAVVMNCLEMLNSSMVVKESRATVLNKYSILASAKNSNDKDIRTIASVVYTKLIASGTLTENPKALLNDLDNYSILFENYILENVKKSKKKSTTKTTLLFSVVEAFAITSSISAVRLRVDKELLDRLATIVRSDDVAWVYGGLTALANLVEYPHKPTAKQRQAEDVRKKTGALAAFDVDTKLDVQQVMSIAQKFLDTSLLTYLSSATSKLSEESREQVARILQSLTSHQKGQMRLNASKQGAAIIAVYLWVDDQTKLEPEYKAIAASAVSKIVTSVDPHNIFTHKFTPIAVIDPLKHQLNNSNSERPNLDTFESLMALTNIASIENDKLNELIVEKCWTRIEDCLATEYVQIQKGVFQLICNLSYCDACADKFTARNDKGDFLRSVLGHGLQLDDTDAQIACAGAIAILCGQPEMPELFGHNVAVMENLIKTVESDNDDILLRTVTALHDIMLRSVKRNDDEAIEAVIYYGGVPRLEELITRVNRGNKELVSIVAKTIKLLIHFKLVERAGR